MADLEDLDVGLVMDMAEELSRESISYPVLATQEDMDRF
jgi:hypothetical protein